MSSASSRRGESSGARSLIRALAMVVLATASACVSVRQIGRVNMISNRNVNPQLNYQPIATYAGGSRAELTRSRSLSVEDAVNQTVRRVPGGEFVVNAKIYVVDEKYFAVEGDVWGAAEQSYRGFKVGDRVTFKNPALFTTQRFLLGTVVALKSTELCLVQPEAQGAGLVEVSYDDLTRSVSAAGSAASTPAPAAPADRTGQQTPDSPTRPAPVSPARQPLAPNSRQQPGAAEGGSASSQSGSSAAAFVTSKCSEALVRQMMSAGMGESAIREACR